MPTFVIVVERAGSEHVRHIRVNQEGGRRVRPWWLWRAFKKIGDETAATERGVTLRTSQADETAESCRLGGPVFLLV